MPFRTIYTDNTGAYWIPKAIDCYHAVKVKTLTFVVRFTGATAGTIIAGFDKVPSIPIAAGASYDHIKVSLAAAAAESVTFHIDNMDEIIGDYLYVTTNSASIFVNVIVQYEIIKTKFSQYGQAEKTLTRAMQ
jgi:hypothetical protein